jgi:hypothetical protein
VSRIFLSLGTANPDGNLDRQRIGERQAKRNVPQEGNRRHSPRSAWETLAQKNGQSDDVKSYGKMLSTDHAAANQKALDAAKGLE